MSFLFVVSTCHFLPNFSDHWSNIGGVIVKKVVVYVDDGICLAQADKTKVSSQFIRILFPRVALLLTLLSLHGNCPFGCRG